MTIYSRGFARQRDKLKRFFYHITDGHQFCQSGDIQWGAPTDKVTSWSFNYLVLWGHVRSWWHKNSTITMPTFSKLIREVVFSEQLPPVNSHNPSKRWSCEFTWQIKYIIFPLAEDSSNTKLGTVLIYRERLPPLTKREVTWHFKNLKTLSFEKFKSPLSQDFWPLNLAKCWLWGGDSTRKRMRVE